MAVDHVMAVRLNGHRLRKLARGLAFHTPLRAHLGPWYGYLHTPVQLAFLCRCLDDTRDVPGCVVEAGCYRGQTTLYLNRHMTAEGIDKPYIAIDTFSGFRRADLDAEVRRGKQPDYYRGRFGVNDQRWFDAAMRRGGATRVRSIAADVGAFDFAGLAPIAFCLLDVIFYQPTRLALPRIWKGLSPGGIIVVDDLHREKHPDSGGGQAFREFVANLGLEPRVEHTKYGVLTKAP